MILEGFDVEANAQEENNFEAIPVGAYNAIIISSEMKETKAGGNKGINLKFQIVDGQFKNRSLYHWINWEHKNEKAQQIGRGQLSAICKAIGALKPSSTEELHNQILSIYVKIEDSEQYGKSNKITNFKKAKSAVEQAVQEPTGWQM